MLMLAACAQQPATTGDGQPESGSGRVVFAITDAAADMGAVSSVEMTIDSVQARNKAGAWVSVSSAQQTYDLLELKANGETALLADATLPEGEYEEIRLQVSDVVVTDAQGEHDAKLPSGELKLKGEFTASGDATAAATLDFVADESLHVTGNGKYVMAPVVRVETRDDANVAVDDDTVVVSGGTVRTQATLGMDINGNVGVGASIPANAALDIDAGGVLVGLGGSAGSDGDGDDGGLNVTGSGGIGVTY
jgi:hypothetical protein